ncbi:hypothetical protein ACSTI6_23730, partial [Vibrio parahaemolyticus]
DGDKVALLPMSFDTVSMRNGRSSLENMYHLLVTEFQHSQAMGYSVEYNTAFRNCTTENFDVFDLAFPETLATSGKGGYA